MPRAAFVDRLCVYQLGFLLCALSGCIISGTGLFPSRLVPFELQGGRILGFGVEFPPMPGRAGCAVAIYQVIRTLSLDPEEIERLTTAYEKALLALQLSNRADPITTIVAERIIEAAKTGERDSDTLCAMAIKDLRIP